MLILPLAIIFAIVAMAVEKGILKATFGLLCCIAVVSLFIVPAHRIHVDGLEVAPIIWDKTCFPMLEGEANYVRYEVDSNYSDRISCFKVKVYDRYGSPKMAELPGGQTAFVGIDTDTDKVRVHTFALTTPSRLLLVGYNRRYVIVAPSDYLRAGENVLMSFGVRMYYQKEGELSPDLLKWIGTRDAESVVAQAEAPPKPTVE